MKYLEQRNDIKNPVAYLTKVVANKDLAISLTKKAKEEAQPIVHISPKPKPEDSIETARNTLRDLYANRVNDVIVETLRNSSEAQSFLTFVKALSQQERIPVHIEIAITIFNKLNVQVDTLAEQLRDGSGMIQGLKLLYFQEKHPTRLEEIRTTFQPLANNLGFILE
ncbi:hypothetical protein BWI97_26095 [Siphonobacter sp. BAB-5405]|uniref:hypothetical protein n=1 Tax=Siphonobacter sp. BAB-5405 TaxID=1864825 RepID=UPI000C80EEF0|nr:hypothetical protein [Siphonobacter sp. BAB-5405]PMD86848.1 hypothetical protein BWI97_26095 [Siphonobacter sp. BAB-5405]